jgi:exosortase E/protease (VPEID-CTERM system)
MTTLSHILAPSGRALRLGGLFLAEAVLMVAVFQVSVDLECRATGIEAACRGLRWAGVWFICAASLLGVWLWARPEARAAFLRMCIQEPGGVRWALVHLLGLALILVPIFLVAPGEMNAHFAALFPLLCLGALLATLGGLIWLARPAAWAGWLDGRLASLLAITGFAAALPGIVVLAGPLWTVQVLTDVTFIAVYLMLQLFSGEVGVNPEAYIIGADGFFVEVADSCSGIEGLVLITAFLGLAGDLAAGTSGKLDVQRAAHHGAYSHRRAWLAGPCRQRVSQLCRMDHVHRAGGGDPRAGEPLALCLAGGCAGGRHGPCAVRG